MNDRLQLLFNKYITETITPEEKAELSGLINRSNNQEVAALLKEEWDKTGEDVSFLSSTEAESILQGIMEAKTLTVHRIPFFKQTWFRVAAAVLLLVGVFAIYKLTGNSKAEQPIAKVENTKQDIAPGGNKAILTLADGSTIILDNAANGNLAEQGNSKIVKLNNGQLAYNALNEKPTEIVFNTVSTPRGGQYQLVLADGSKVWLNAASTLRFPTSFVGKERKVELVGEGYFEIAKNAAMPFKIDVAGKGEVEVLGTHFNINSYNNEPAINTTLIEGSVKVTGLTLGKTVVLMPGQQAQLSGTGDISINRNPDIASVMAWKNEKFVFQNADLKSIMRQLERWYDISVSYEGNGYTDEYVGIISRNVNISQILRMMEKISPVRFEINGKNIIVK